jgi:hypothetical protein
MYWGREDEALETLIRVRGTDVSDPFVQKTRNDIIEVIALETSVKQPLWRSLFWDSSPVRNSRRVYIPLLFCRILRGLIAVNLQSSYFYGQNLSGCCLN